MSSRRPRDAPAKAPTYRRKRHNSNSNSFKFSTLTSIAQWINNR